MGAWELREVRGDDLALGRQIGCADERPRGIQRVVAIVRL